MEGSENRPYGKEPIEMIDQRTRMCNRIWIAAIMLLACAWFLPLSVQAAESAAAVTVQSAIIQDASVIVTTSGLAASEDGYYHLYAQGIYESGDKGTEVAAVPVSDAAIFRFPLAEGETASRLYDRFAVYIIVHGQRKAVSNAVYISNPEAIAPVAATRLDISKKGILPDAAMIETDMDALKEMGIHQITYNVNLGDLMTNGSIPYEYNGRQYYINADVVGSLDRVVPRANVRQIQVSLILLNNRTSDSSLIHPKARGYTKAQYYAYNTTDQKACERLAAAVSYLAQRYNGGDPGTVDNWIVGNEVNARAEWNYIDASVGMSGLVRAYADEFRICYNAVKAQNANARVFLSLDHQYGAAENASLYYPGREVLEAFNNLIAAEGNIDWNVAIHPYNADMRDPVAWTTSASVTQEQTSPYITMQNVHLITDLLQTQTFLTTGGAVRRTFVSEIGYNGSGNQAAQAASVVYGYLQCLYNPFIDGYIYCRQTDDQTELAQGLALGLQTARHAARSARSFYTNADDEGIQAQVAAVMGVASIENAIPQMVADPAYTEEQHTYQLSLEWTKTAHMGDLLELP